MPGDDVDGVPVWLPEVGWVPAESWLEMLLEDDAEGDAEQPAPYDA